jgi:hypothetical protein
MGDDTILEAIGKRNIKATMQVGGKMLFTTTFKFPKCFGGLHNGV